MGGSQGGARGGFCPKRSQKQKCRDGGGVAWALASVWVLEPLEDGTHCRAWSLLIMETWQASIANTAYGWVPAVRPRREESSLWPGCSVSGWWLA